MIDVENILMSLDLRHADKIFAGSKHVELRRRNMHVSLETVVWVYATLPTGAIIGSAKIVKIHLASPADLWQFYSEVSGLTEVEFFDYFNGVTEGVALVLEDATRLPQKLSLNNLREISRSFHPPQFFTRLTAKNPILVALLAQKARATNWPLTNSNPIVKAELLEFVNAD